MTENNTNFEEMLICYKLGLHETGHIVYGEQFLSVGATDTISSIIRRLYPIMVANDIIGVQPMTGPVGQIHTLRTRYKC